MLGTATVQTFSGWAGTRQKAALLRDLIERHASDPRIVQIARSIAAQAGARDPIAIARALAARVRALPYTAERDELFAAPLDTLRVGGDCDDHVILLGALIEAIGIPSKVTILGDASTGEGRHVYVSAGFPVEAPARWLQLDTTRNASRRWNARGLGAADDLDDDAWGDWADDEDEGWEDIDLGDEGDEYDAGDEGDEYDAGDENDEYDAGDEGDEYDAGDENDEGEEYEYDLGPEAEPETHWSPSGQAAGAAAGAAAGTAAAAAKKTGKEPRGPGFWETAAGEFLQSGGTALAKGAIHGVKEALAEPLPKLAKQGAAQAGKKAGAKAGGMLAKAFSSPMVWVGLAVAGGLMFALARPPK